MTDHELFPRPEVIVNPLGERVALRFDVVPLLEIAIGLDWQERLSEVLESGELVPRAAEGHESNREAGNSGNLCLVTTTGARLGALTPGLWELYRGPFRDLMKQAVPEGAEPFKLYDTPEKALEGLSQVPVSEVGGLDQNRMEAHVDQRYTAVLVVDVPEDESAGGRLVISNNPNAKNVGEINQDATFIKHVPGTLVCFSEGRKYPHYTEEMTDLSARRMVVSMNYPPESESPEAADALQAHIAGLKQ